MHVRRIISHSAVRSACRDSRQVVSRTLFYFASILLLASCATTSRQEPADRAAAISAIQVGQEVKATYSDPRGWSSTSTCKVTFKNEEGMTCGLDFIFFDRLTAIGRKRGEVPGIVLIPLIPVAVAAWVVASVVAPPEKPPDAMAPDHCGVSFYDTITAKQSTTIIRVPQVFDADSHYQGDSKPDTIEIVTWAIGQHGRSRIEADGEVIYLVPDGPEEAKRQLVSEAIYLKVLVRSNRKEQCGGVWSSSQ